MYVIILALFYNIIFCYACDPIGPAIKRFEESRMEDGATAMSLPKAFTTDEEYFSSCLEFFAKHFYLIKHANTHIMLHTVLDNIGNEIYLQHLDIENKEFNLADLRNMSEYLDDFLNDVAKLSAEYDSVNEVEIVEFEAPMSEKKKYEVVRLAKEISKFCGEHGCDTVIDVGSGLGYLDERLYNTAGLKVVGLESNGGHYHRAKQRQQQYHPESSDSVVYARLKVTENSAENIERTLKESFVSHGPVCMTGLHACADLSVDGIDVFLKMADVRALILVPCCYHRMQQEDSGFKNFPLSKLLSKICDQLGLKLGVPLLRLAAHPPVNNRSLYEMAFCLLARALLESYARIKRCTLRRNRRRAIKFCTTFERYAKQLAAGYTLVPDINQNTETTDPTQHTGGKVNFDMDMLFELFDRLQPIDFKKASVYIQLQNWLQPVVENFILYDRLVYLKENGVLNCRHKKFFNEKQSPRCIALLAVK